LLYSLLKCCLENFPKYLNKFYNLIEKCCSYICNKILDLLEWFCKILEKILTLIWKVFHFIFFNIIYTLIIRSIYRCLRYIFVNYINPPLLVIYKFLSKICSKIYACLKVVMNFLCGILRKILSKYLLFNE
jgi:phage-related protein